MKMAAVLTCVLSFAIAPAGPAADQRASIDIEDASGKQRTSFQPRDKPYAAGMRAVASVFLHDRQDIIDDEGLAVTGFGFYGWNDGTSVHVQVFTLVPAQGSPNRYLARPGDNTATSLRLKEFATLTLSAGKAATIDRMKALKLEPFTVRMTVKVPSTLVATGTAGTGR